MKSLVTLLITVFASAAFAGGSGGGGVMMNNFMVRPDRSFELGGAGGGLRPGSEIVFHMGQENGVVKFAYGHLEDNRWKVQKLALPIEDLVLDSPASTAIKKSKDAHQWVQIN